MDYGQACRQTSIFRIPEGLPVVRPQSPLRVNFSQTEPRLAFDCAVRGSVVSPLPVLVSRNTCISGRNNGGGAWEGLRHLLWLV